MLNTDIYLPKEARIVSSKSDLSQIKCLVLVHDTNHTAQEEEVLHKLLGAIKLDPASTCEVIYGYEQYDINAFVAASGVEHILVFVDENQAIPFNINLPKYSIQRIGTLSLLSSDSIKTLNSKSDLKKKLWSLLQAMFLNK